MDRRRRRGVRDRPPKQQRGPFGMRYIYKCLLNVLQCLSELSDLRRSVHRGPV